MAISPDVLDSEVVQSLARMYTAEYTPRAFLFRNEPSVPGMLNAVGACGGFAAQAAVWRELILPAGRNPGEFLVHVGTKANETFFLGEAINQFLFATIQGRLSFLSLAAAPLSSPSELCDIGGIAGHVARTLGADSFGRPRVPNAVRLPELPRAALKRTWGKAARILDAHPPAEWPVLLGAATYRLITANHKTVAPPLAVRIVLEAAVPMSKLDPRTVEQSGVRIPAVTSWSMRAFQAETQEEVIAEVRNAMPAAPQNVAAPSVIAQPTIAFLNLSGRTCATIAAQDEAEIGALFRGRVERSSSTVPRCEVLFLYCAFDASGGISGGILGATRSLADLIRASGARVAVVASEVAPDVTSAPGFQALASGDLPVNVVIVTNRNGRHFARFFRSLFQQMWEGVPMPMAWVKLAPQGPYQPEDIPGSICLMAAGGVTFTG